MAYPFVQATYDYGPRRGPALAFVVHMAEGGGTVGYLSGPNVMRGVSVHYVIEYSGRIVQMLDERHASGSINPQTIRQDDDPPFNGVTFGRTAAVAVMGSWADDPNSACISLEIEGFAKDGPNTAQSTALHRLYADVSMRHSGIGSLGHRDFQTEKPCPGKLIPWAMVGGHAQGGVQVDIPVVDPKPKLVDLTAGDDVLSADGAAKILDAPQARTCLSPFASQTPSGTATRVIVWTTAGTDFLRAVYTSQVTVRDLPTDGLVTKDAAATAAADAIHAL